MRLRLSLCIAVGVNLFADALPAQTPDWLERVVKAAQLPVEADGARKEGVPNDVVAQVLEAMRTADVPAGEARDILEAEREARREHGPVDNFGAFVQSRLDAGLRGQELAAAIRAEHRARGRARVERAGQPDDRGAAGREADRGRSAEARDTAREQRDRSDRRPGKQPEAGEGRQRRPSDRPEKPNR